jgi:hypothetical protein
MAWQFPWGHAVSVDTSWPSISVTYQHHLQGRVLTHAGWYPCIFSHLYFSECWGGYIQRKGEVSNECDFVIRKPQRIDICGSALRVWKDNIELCISGAWFEASAAKQIRTALFWVLADVSRRPVGPILTTEYGTRGFPETSGRNCHHWLRNNPEERSTLILTNSK